MRNSSRRRPLQGALDGGGDLAGAVGERFGDVSVGDGLVQFVVVDPPDAAAVAAYANGRAGELVIEEYGHGLTATDLLDAVPRALWPNG